jgi:hypothetical protein
VALDVWYAPVNKNVMMSIMIGVKGVQRAPQEGKPSWLVVVSEASGWAREDSRLLQNQTPVPSTLTHTT